MLLSWFHCVGVVLVTSLHMVAVNIAAVTDDDLERNVLSSIRAAREKAAVGDLESAEGLSKKITKLCRDGLDAARQLHKPDAGSSSSSSDVAIKEAVDAEQQASEESSAVAPRHHDDHDTMMDVVRRQKLLIAALNCSAFILKATGKAMKAVRSAREAFDIESECHLKTATTALNLCVLYIAVGKYDAAVTMADEATAIASNVSSSAPVMMAAVHYNRGNALLHRLTELGVGKASDAFAALQLAKSYARDAGADGERLFALADRAALSVLEQFGPQVTQQTTQRGPATHRAVTGEGAASSSTKPRVPKVPKGKTRLPSLYRQTAPRPPKTQQAATARRPHDTSTVRALPPIGKPVHVPPTPPPRTPPPRTPVAAASTKPTAVAVDQEPISPRGSSRKSRRAEARTKAAMELRARQSPPSSTLQSSSSRPATQQLADKPVQPPATAVTTSVAPQPPTARRSPSPVQNTALRRTPSPVRRSPSPVATPPLQRSPSPEEAKAVPSVAASDAKHSPPHTYSSPRYSPTPSPPPPSTPPRSPTPTATVVSASPPRHISTPPQSPPVDYEDDDDFDLDG